MGSYASVAVRDSYGNIVGYASTSTGQIVETTGAASASFQAERAKAEGSGGFTSQERYFDTRTAAGISAQVSSVGGVTNPYVASVAVAEGANPSGIFLPGAQGEQVRFDQANVQNIDLGRSTVPIRTIIPASAGLGGPISTGGTTTTIYMPTSEYQTIAVRNANLVADYNTGEFGVYQRIYDPKTGQERRITNLVGGGGRAALQSGMFSYEESNAPAEYTYNQWEAGNISAVSREYAMTRSRLGAEAYGGYSGIPLDTRTIQSTGAQMSTFANQYNLATLVNPTGANLSKREAPGMDLAWTQSPDIAAVTVLNYQKPGQTLQINIQPVGQPVAIPTRNQALGVGSKILQNGDLGVVRPFVSSPSASVEQTVPKPFVSTAGTTSAPSEQWYTGIPVVGGLVPSGVFRRTSEITEPGYRTLATSIAPVVITKTGPETMVPMASIGSGEAGPEYSYRYIESSGKSVPVMAKVTPVTTTFAPSPAAVAVSNVISPVTTGYEQAKGFVQARLPESSRIEPLVRQAQIFNPITGPFVAASYAAPAAARAIPGSPEWYKKQVEANAQTMYAVAPGSLAGQYTQFREEPFITPASYALGLGIGGVTRGVAAAYPKVRSVFETGRKSTAVFNAAERVVPAGLTALYGADIAYRSTAGFTTTEGALVRSRGIIVQESAPMLAGASAGYRAPEILSSAYRRIPSSAQIRTGIEEFAWRREYGVTRMGPEPLRAQSAAGPAITTEPRLLQSGPRISGPLTDTTLSPQARGISESTLTTISRPAVSELTVSRGVMLYGREFYKPINAYLRGNESKYFKSPIDTFNVMGSSITLPETQEAAYALVHGINEYGRPLPEDIVVYRGIESGSSVAANIESKAIGDIYRDVGLQSFTTRPSIASIFAGDRDRGIILKYTIPAGSRVYTPNEAASEITIPPGEFIISNIYDVPRKDIAKAIYEDQNENAITRVVEIAGFKRIIPDVVSEKYFEPMEKPEPQPIYSEFDYIRSGPKLLETTRQVDIPRTITINEARTASYSFRNGQVSISENRRFTGQFTRDVSSAVTYNVNKLSEPIAEIPAWTTRRNVAVTARTSQTTVIEPFTGRMSAYVQKSYELSPSPRKTPPGYEGEEYGYSMDLYNLPMRVERVGEGVAQPPLQVSAIKSLKFTEARETGILDIEAKRTYDLSYGEASTGFTPGEMVSQKIQARYELESIKTPEINRVFEDIITSERPVESGLTYRTGVPRPNVLRAAAERQGNIAEFGRRPVPARKIPEIEIPTERNVLNMKKMGPVREAVPGTGQRAVTEAPRMSATGRVQESIQRAISDIKPRRGPESIETKMQQAVQFRKKTEARNLQAFSAQNLPRVGTSGADASEFAKPTAISAIINRQTPATRERAMVSAREFQQNTIIGNRIKFEEAKIRMLAPTPREPESISDTTGLALYSNAMFEAYRRGRRERSDLIMESAGVEDAISEASENGIRVIEISRDGNLIGVDRAGRIVEFEVSGRQTREEVARYRMQDQLSRVDIQRDIRRGSIAGGRIRPFEITEPSVEQRRRPDTRPDVLIGPIVGPTQETTQTQTTETLPPAVPPTRPGTPTFPPTTQPPTQRPPVVSPPPFIPQGGPTGSSYGRPRTRSWTETNPVGADILGAKRAMNFEAPTPRQFRPKMKGFKFKSPRF